MYHLLNTLYVMTPNAYAHLENDTLRIDVERQKKLQVPLHHLGSVVCFGNVMISPALVAPSLTAGRGLNPPGTIQVLRQAGNARL